MTAINQLISSVTHKLPVTKERISCYSLHII